MEEAAAARALRQVVEDFNSHDPERLDHLCREDVRHEVLALRAVWRGRAARRAGLQRIWESSPDVAIHLRSLIGDAERAVGEWVISGTLERPYGDMPATRRRFAVRGTTFLILVDGLVQLQTDYWDLPTLLRQLGLMPPTATG